MEVRKTGLGSRVSEGTRLLWVAIRERGWSQGELARQLGTSNGVTNRWLHGRRAPDRDWAEKIRVLLGIPNDAWSLPPTEPFQLKLSA